MSPVSSKTALVVGATGVVGRELVRQLCAHPAYVRVIAWVRSPWPQAHPKLDVWVLDFDRIGQIPAEAVDEIYCGLGTTIKQAGSRERFLKVDVDYPTAVGQWGRRAGVPRFLLVSAPGANPHSQVFYLRAKGQAEQALKDCGYPVLDIFHPPLIAGERPDKRTGERLMIAVFRHLPPSWFAAYRPMSGAEIAACIIDVAQQAGQGVHTHRLAAASPPAAQQSKESS